MALVHGSLSVRWTVAGLPSDCLVALRNLDIGGKKSNHTFHIPGLVLRQCFSSYLSRSLSGISIRFEAHVYVGSHWFNSVSLPTLN